MSVSMSVSIREAQDAPKHVSAATRQGVTADTSLTCCFTDYFAEGPTWTLIVEPFSGSLTILIRVLVSVILTPAVGFDVS